MHHWGPSGSDDEFGQWVESRLTGIERYHAMAIWWAPLNARERPFVRDFIGMVVQGKMPSAKQVQWFVRLYRQFVPSNVVQLAAYRRSQ
jgi:hypothetical protein